MMVASDNETCLAVYCTLQNAVIRIICDLIDNSFWLDQL